MGLGKRTRQMKLSVLQESFRILKTNIQFYMKENKIKTITITSCSTGEGKTTIATNLAKSLALSGNKVLLVDAEFRKQRNVYQNKIIKSQVMAKIDFREAYPDRLIKDTSVHNLNYLSIGSSILNPETLIDSAQLKSFINNLSKEYDIVIIDAPPLGGVIDGALLGTNTDASILVIQSGLHDYRTVLNMKEQLEKAKVKIIGVTLCKVDKRNLKSYLDYQKYCSKKKANKIFEMNKLEIMG